MKNKQAGGIVSFIIVFIALAGLLAGGLYLSKQQGRTARDNDTSAPQVSTNQDKEQEQKQGNNQQGATTPGSNNQQNNTPYQAPQQNQNQAQQTPSTPAPSSDRVANTGPSEELPSTGPGETAAVTLALSVLAFAGYRAIQSRRSLRHSALRS